MQLCRSDSITCVACILLWALTLFPWAISLKLMEGLDPCFHNKFKLSSNNPSNGTIFDYEFKDSFMEVSFSIQRLMIGTPLKELEKDALNFT